MTANLAASSVGAIHESPVCTGTHRFLSKTAALDKQQANGGLCAARETEGMKDKLPIALAKEMVPFACFGLSRVKLRRLSRTGGFRFPPLDPLDSLTPSPTRGFGPWTPGWEQQAVSSVGAIHESPVRAGTYWFLWMTAARVVSAQAPKGIFLSRTVACFQKEVPICAPPALPNLPPPPQGSRGHAPGRFKGDTGVQRI